MVNHTLNAVHVPDTADRPEHPRDASTSAGLCRGSPDRGVIGPAPQRPTHSPRTRKRWEPSPSHASVSLSAATSGVRSPRRSARSRGGRQPTTDRNARAPSPARGRGDNEELLDGREHRAADPDRACGVAQIRRVGLAGRQDAPNLVEGVFARVEIGVECVEDRAELAVLVHQVDQPLARDDALGRGSVRSRSAP